MQCVIPKNIHTPFMEGFLGIGDMKTCCSKLSLSTEVLKLKGIFVTNCYYQIFNITVFNFYFNQLCRTLKSIHVHLIAITLSYKKARSRN